MNAFQKRLPLLLIVAAPSWAAGQGPARPADPDAPGVTLHSTTTLVQVGVVAEDKQGQPVTGLTKDEFEVLDNGRPRPIATFIVETPGAETWRALAPNTFTNQFTDVEGSHGGYVVVVLDWLNTSMVSTVRARQQVIEMLNQFGPTDKVALYTLDWSGLRVVAEFGSGTAALLAKLASLRVQKSPYAQKDLNINDDGMTADEIGFLPGDHPDAVDYQMQKLEENYFVDLRIRDTLRAFEAIAGHLAGVPGRKGLIWVSSAFPTEIQERPDAGALFKQVTPATRTYGERVELSIRKLNDANVSVYAVDARGLMTGSPVSRTGENMTTQTMDHFALATGGFAYHGRNELALGMRKALDDVRIGYTLGFYAPSDSARAGFHRLTVRVRKPGVTLRYREGYSVDEAPSLTAEDRKALAAKDLISPVDSTAIPIQTKIDRNGNDLALRIVLDPPSLGLTRTGDRWQGQIDLVMRFAVDNGEESGSPSSETIDLNLTQKSYEAAVRDGLVLARTVRVPPGATRVRVLILNDVSGQTGMLTIPLRDITGR